MLRFNVGWLLIATTFVAGMAAAAKYGPEAMATFVIFASASLLFFWGATEAIKVDNANNKREKRDREGN